MSGPAGATEQAPRCSIVIPVHGRAGLTRQCIDAILDEPPQAIFELIVVDDASPDDTIDVLSAYGDTVRVVARRENGGFARASNDGAAAARGEYLVFLNNDTLPLAGWLDELVTVADADPRAGAVGSRLLFPNDTIQHAGVVVCQDGNPRHIYAGFPADHPAVNRPRTFQAVTAASMLVRREAFERVNGFDATFHNSLEDTDLCMRLGEEGLQIRYCPASVLYHLESVSRGRRSSEIAENTRLFKQRWGDKAERDDLRRYVEDGLLRVRYRDIYPVRIELAPELAAAAGPEADRFVELQSQQVADLLRETVRLTAHVADLELGVKAGERDSKPQSLPAAERPAEGIEGLVADADRLQLDIHAFQARIAEALEHAGEPGSNGRRFTPGDRLAYLELKERMKPVVEATVPAGEIALIVSRGDESLVALAGAGGRHFPQEPDGAYAGRHPADSAEAIAQLEDLRARGARYLLIPETDAWWLDHYGDLARHLNGRYVALTHPGAPCLVFRLDHEGTARSSRSASPRRT
jgi:GT2 family glycosyltransferase